MPFCPRCDIEVDEQDKFCRKYGLEMRTKESTIEGSDAGLEYEKNNETH